jgi:rhodanese-related sulfurtransferase
MTGTFVKLSSCCLLAVALACAAGPTPAGEISAEELLAVAGTPEAPLVLDVRSADEYASGHVPGAKNITFDTVGARLDELGSPGEIVVYCESGRRAAKAEAVLEEAGFHVRHLTGDMKAWREAGHPTER